MDVSIKLFYLSFVSLLARNPVDATGRMQHGQVLDVQWAINKIHLSIPPYNVYSIQIMLKSDNRKLQCKPHNVRYVGLAVYGQKTTGHKTTGQKATIVEIL